MANSDKMENRNEIREIHKNPHLKEMPEDVLYHLGLSTKKDDLKEMFGDVKVKIGRNVEILGLNFTPPNDFFRWFRFFLFAVRLYGWYPAKNGIFCPVHAARNRPQNSNWNWPR